MLIVARATIFLYDHRMTTADDDITLLGFMLEIAHGMTDQNEQWLADAFDLTPVAFEILIRLKRSPEMRLRLADLADQVTMSPSGMTRALDKLESEGFVLREHCPQDRRGIFATLTTAGNKRISPVITAHAKHLDAKVLAGLSRRERTELLRLLRPIRDRINPRAAAASSPRSA